MLNRQKYPSINASTVEGSHIVCSPCGISANVLTCLKKYGRSPKKLCFDVSTSHIGICDICGDETNVTEERDFFYPDFSLLTHASSSDSTLREILQEVGEEDEQSPYRHPTDLNGHFIAGINQERQRVRAIITKHLEKKV